jgi:hypothetical protein
MQAGATEGKHFRSCDPLGAGGRPEASVAEGGPVGFSDGGNRRDWFPGVRGLRAASNAEGRSHILKCFPEVGLENLFK